MTNKKVLNRENWFLTPVSLNCCRWVPPCELILYDPSSNGAAGSLGTVGFRRDFYYDRKGLSWRYRISLRDRFSDKVWREFFDFVPSRKGVFLVWVGWGGALYAGSRKRGWRVMEDSDSPVRMNDRRRRGWRHLVLQRSLRWSLGEWLSFWETLCRLLLWWSVKWEVLYLVSREIVDAKEIQNWIHYRSAIDSAKVKASLTTHVNLSNVRVNTTQEGKSQLTQWHLSKYFFSQICQELCQDLCPNISNFLSKVETFWFWEVISDQPIFHSVLMTWETLLVVF